MKLRVHPLFWVLMFVAGFSGHGTKVLSAFFSVVLHEAAHAAAAWAFSYRTYRIDIYPFGGVATMDTSLGADNMAEACTALAGPLYSIFLAALAHYGGDWLGGGVFWRDLTSINISLGLMNFLPLYPLDGGRILRASLAATMGMREATRRVSLFTRWIIGIGLLPAFFLWNRGIIPWTAPLIFVFLWVAAKDPKDYFYLRWRQRERRRKRMETGKAIPVAFHIMNQQAELRDASEAVEGKAYHILLTADERGHVNGWLDEATLWETLIEGRYLGSIASIAKKKLWGEKGVHLQTVEREKSNSSPE